MSVDCDIYNAERIILTCTISTESISDSLISLTSNYLNISWFFNNGTEYELIVGINETRREEGNGSTIIISSTLAISGIPQEDISLLASGSYYCGVNVTGKDVTVVSNFSQQFIALEQDEYLQFATNCSHKSFIANKSNCAVHVLNHRIAYVNPTTIFPQINASMTSNSDVYENPITTNHPSVTEIITVQEADTTIQSSPGQSEGVPEIWIYVLVSMLAVFLIIIIILIVFVLRSRLIVRNADSQLQGSDNIYRKSHTGT